VKEREWEKFKKNEGNVGINEYWEESSQSNGRYTNREFEEYT
jgi:hypothetical protein